MNFQKDKNRVRSETMQKKHILAGTIFLHGMNDMHSTALPTIIPMLAQSISLTLSQAGFLSALFGCMNMFAQPILGYIADRMRRPWFAVWGPLLSITGAAILPMVPNFGTALLCVGMMSFGTSLFHPQGTGSCGAAAPTGTLAFYLSLFQASGTFGSAIGPIYVVFMISMVGKHIFPCIVIPIAFLICLFLWRDLGEVKDAETIAAAKDSHGKFFGNIKFIMGKVGWIVALTTVRDAVYQSIKIFLPTLIIMQGGTIAAGGLTLFVITFASSVAAIVGGKLADKIGDEKVVFTALAAAPIFLGLGIRDSSVLCTTALVIGYVFLQASTPVTTAMSQKRCPEMRGMITSFSNGVSWGLANLLVTPVGIIADHIGLQETLNIVAFVPWIVTLWHFVFIFGKKKTIQ
ncbi:MAG: MFS transporter [Synergistes sp.]|nr:MFS transporter [Synergistes sp.]